MLRKKQSLFDSKTPSKEQTRAMETNEQWISYGWWVGKRNIVDMGWSEPNNHQTDIQIYFEIMNEDTSHQKKRSQRMTRLILHATVRSMDTIQLVSAPRTKIKIQNFSVKKFINFFNNKWWRLTEPAQRTNQRKLMHWHKLDTKQSTIKESPTYIIDKKYWKKHFFVKHR